jgi:phosphatidylcholine synthase
LTQPAALVRLRAVLVHCYTASGALLALLATMELCAPSPDPRRVFLALTLAVLIDATDGTLARRWAI